MKLQYKTIEKLRILINEETEYRSGPDLVSFFDTLGFDDSYGQGFPSRWYYTEENLKRINGTEVMEQCIKQLFSPVNFIGKFNLLDKFITDFNQYLSFDNYKIIRNGKQLSIIESMEDLSLTHDGISENEFLNKEFREIPLEKLGFDGIITSILEQRLDEIKKCLNAKSSLAVIFLCGSTLEGILLGVAIKNPQKFNKSKISPKDKSGIVLQFHDWTLSGFIDVARDINILDEDIKKFSHALRDFRNYIHPYQQSISGFNPDEHTAKICWQVLRAAIYDLVNKNS